MSRPLSPAGCLPRPEPLLPETITHNLLFQHFVTWQQTVELTGTSLAHLMTNLRLQHTTVIHIAVLQ